MAGSAYVATGARVEEDELDAGLAPGGPAPIATVPGALPAELLQMLNGVTRTLNEDGELEALPPAAPATLAPAFSRDTLEALRAERLARRAAAPLPSSARPERSSLSSLTLSDPPKPPK